ncbi:MAG: PA14 domain-containing protein [Acidobacteriota bacterium]
MKISRPIAAVVSLLAAIPLFGAGNGLKGDYFANTGMIGSPVASRTDATVNFNWSGAPVAGISSNYFSVRWSGKVEAPVTGAYKLATYSNEGVRVWLSGTLIIDHWNAHSLERDAANPVNLTAGQKYDLKIEFYDRSGAANRPAALELPWAG